MPNWQPNWDDVRWDFGASQTAISELQHMADLLDDVTYRRSIAAREAIEQWLGRHRERFDGDFHALISQAAALAAECRAAAGRIAAKGREAELEQQERVRQRQRWFAEKEEEDRERARREEEARERARRDEETRQGTRG